MRLPANIANRGWDMHGVRTSYDHVTVKRWLAGSVCQLGSKSRRR
jgi:hypothetical protein